MDLLALSHMTCAAKRSITRTAHRYTTIFRTPATHGSDRGADGGGQARIGKGARSGKNDAKAAVAGYNTKTDANKDKDVGTRQDTRYETTSIRDHISSPTLHAAARRSRQENRHLKSLDLHRDQRQFLNPTSSTPRTYNTAPRSTISHLGPIILPHSRCLLLSKGKCEEERKHATSKHLPICPQNTLTEPGGLVGCFPSKHTDGHNGARPTCTCGNQTSAVRACNPQAFTANAPQPPPFQLPHANPATQEA